MRGGRLQEVVATTGLTVCALVSKAGSWNNS